MPISFLHLTPYDHGVMQAGTNPAATQPSSAPMRTFFNTSMFTLPFLENPASLMNVMTGTGVYMAVLCWLSP
jgi:hypothetical protein